MRASETEQTDGRGRMRSRKKRGREKGKKSRLPDALQNARTNTLAAKVALASISLALACWSCTAPCASRSLLVSYPFYAFFWYLSSFVDPPYHPPIISCPFVTDPRFYDFGCPPPLWLSLPSRDDTVMGIRMRYFKLFRILFNFNLIYAC